MSSEAKHARIAKAVPVFREEVSGFKDLDAEGNDGELARTR